MQLWLAGTNAWFVAPDGPGGECVLVDAPPNPGVILAHLVEHDLRLVALLGTHGHVDHVGGIPEVVRAVETDVPVPVHIHDADRHMLLDPVGTSGTLGQLLEYEGLDLRPPELLCGLDDGQRVSGAGMTFTAIHTPGHTQGSVCFLLEVDGEAPVLFSGDHLFAGSVGRTDLPGGSHAALLESMATKILPLDDEVRVLPGHGTTTTIGHERRANPFLVGLTSPSGASDDPAVLPVPGDVVADGVGDVG
ncbi:MAG: MBL fold metallo-hydrolase [Actinomycetota bacterium]|nr:MBL fold metallo-hydrolase [Actinomycetota bacterium]